MTDSTDRFGRLRRPLLALASAAVLAAGLAACDSDAGATPHRPAASSATPHRPAASSSTTAPRSTVHKVSTNGHELAFYVTPGAQPAIVLDAGGGMDASEWKKVAPAIAAKTGSEVITYDRAGVGSSDDVPGPWRAADAASDLAAGLSQLGVTKDIVLVSHSLAGEVALAFAHSHPTWVTGAVLVDANLPQFFTPDETARLVAANQQQIDALKKKPSTRQTRQLLAEADDYGPVHAKYHAMTWPSSIPATVVVSAKTPFPTQLDAQRWRQAQHEFADAATNRRLVVAERSSHDVPLDRPDVVIKTVGDLLRRTR